MYILEKGLSYQRLILVVQEKPDCSVSETRLFSFRGFEPPGQNLPPHHFSHFFLSLTHTRTTVRATPRPPLVIPWFLHEILEFLGETNSPRTGASVPPTKFSSSRGALCQTMRKKGGSRQGTMSLNSINEEGSKAPPVSKICLEVT
jgi:hypothetical protein